MMRADDILWALAAVVPVSAVGLAAGAILERAGGSATARERIWSAAFWLGPAACLLALTVDALPRRTADEITVVLRSTPLGAVSQATRALAQVPQSVVQAPRGQPPHVVDLLLGHLPQVPDLLLGAVALGLAFRLAKLAQAWLALRTLRRGAVTAPEATIRAARAAGLKPWAPVKLSAEASTPVVVGLFSPVVLLPWRFATPEAAALVALVCRHEAQHVRRRDNLRLLLEQLAGALFWFDPLRGALHRSVLAAREERCDAAALAGCEPAERRLYARTLLEELTQPILPALAVGLTGAGRSHAMTRISSILDPQPARRRPALALALCGALACAGGGTAYAANQAAQPLRALASQAGSSAATLVPVSAAPAGGASTAPAGDKAPPKPETLRPGQPLVVRDILVLGNSTVPVSTILAQLPITRGQTVGVADLKAAMKALSDTGLFEDVGMTLVDGDLRVRVAEKRDICTVDILDPPKKVLAAIPRGPCDVLHQRIVRLAQAKGVQVDPVNTLPLTVEAASGRAIQRIVVEGDLRDVPEGMVVDLLRMSRMNIVPGRILTPADAALATEYLLNGGLFSKVSARIEDDDSIQPGGAMLKVVATEKPGGLGRGNFAFPAAQTDGPIEITADKLERFEPRLVRYTGLAEIRGDLKRLFEQRRVTFDGQPAPANFATPRWVQADAIELRFMDDSDGGRGKIEAMNIKGLRHAE